jgi:hypothetical protein
VIFAPTSSGGGGGGGGASSGTTGTTTETQKTRPVGTDQAKASPQKKEREAQIERILAEAQAIFKDGLQKMLALLKQKQDTALEKKFANKIDTVIGKTKVTKETRAVIHRFVVYGTPETRALGQGERLGVVNSFKAAFGRFPNTEEDWRDAVKIAAGRFPKQISTAKEKEAATLFEKVYRRALNPKDPHDSAALAIAAYGLRPNKRNLASEKSAIGIFKSIFKKAPKTAGDFDLVRSIAYSGARR